MQFIKHQVTYDTLINAENHAINYHVVGDTLAAPSDVKAYKKEQKEAKKLKHFVKSPLGTVTIQQRINLDTIKTVIPLVDMYPLEELQNSAVIQSTDSQCNLKFTTAEGKMSDYRWFFWMVICCSAATFLVTFLAWRITDPAYGKK
jgi:hypothetical protein